MKIRNRISFSVTVLLAVILLCSYFSAKTVERMKDNTENIFSSNYKSIKYSKEMLLALDHYYIDSLASIEVFNMNLDLQKHNISEPTEPEATMKLEKYYKIFIDNSNKENFFTLSSSINNIISINGKAIESKVVVAAKIAKHAYLWIIIFAVFSILIAIFILIKLPKIITKPIEQIADGIIEITNHNYDKRITMAENSEFERVSSAFNGMAKEMEQFQRSSVSKIISLKRYLEIIINAIDEPIMGLNKEKIILFANNAAMSVLNIEREKMINSSALALSMNNDLLRRVIRGMERDNSKPLKIYANDKECYFEVHYNSLPDDSGKVLLLSSISNFKELDNVKANFVSDEFKTAISNMLMNIKTLEDSKAVEDNADNETLTCAIRDNADKLLSYAGELLNIAHVDSGVLQLSPKITKPIELIDYAINATRMLADRFKCNIEVEYPQKITKLFVDSEKIAWVITNLLSNAIHYSSENSRIIIGARETSTTIEIYVKDFGKGIDPRYHKTIFDRYFRVPGTKVQGSGLGLAISKDFVEAHGGTIKVESELGKGSCFIVVFNK